MAIRAASPLAPFWYEPADQEGEPTRFRIRGLTGLELTDVNAGARPVPESKDVVFTSMSIRTALRAALLDWENFMDADGQPIAFGKDVDANIGKLPFDLMGDLFGEILKASRMGGEPAKN